MQFFEKKKSSLFAIAWKRFDKFRFHDELIVSAYPQRSACPTLSYDRSPECRAVVCGYRYTGEAVRLAEEEEAELNVDLVDRICF